jgi:hypothetical protein
MTRSTGRRKHHFKNVLPRDPAVKPFGQWLGANRSFYGTFRTWLRDGGYGDSALNIYGTAARPASRATSARGSSLGHILSTLRSLRSLRLVRLQRS